MTTEISVVVCTHNGARYLGRVLDGLTRQSCPRECFEVVVVDNASTDATGKICEAAYANGEIDALVEEGRLGLSHARNAGVRQARGGVVAFLDDDAIPHPDWVEQLLGAFSDCTVGVAGGRVTLSYDLDRPQWMTENLELYLSKVSLGEEVRDVQLPGEWVAGANIAFRTQLLSEHPFTPALGRNGRLLLSGEEVEVCLRIRDAGWRVVWVPAAIVDHQVPTTRATPKYLRRRAFAGGFSAEMVRAFVQTDWSRTEALWRAARTTGAGVVRSLVHASDSRERTEASVLACSGAGSLKYVLSHRPLPVER